MGSGFSNPLVGGGGGLVYPSIHSPNFHPGGPGWSINKDGSAEFANLTIDNGLALLYSPSPGANNLIASSAKAPGTDRFGNAYLAGDVSYGPGGDGFVASQVAGGGITVWTAATEAGPWLTKGGLGLDKFTVGGHSLYVTQVQADATTGAFGIFAAGGAIYLQPSGDTTGAADTAKITTALNSSTCVILAPGTFYINNTITIPSGCALVGAFPTQVDGASGFSAGTMTEQGTVLQCAGAFVTGPFPAAVIACSNTTVTQQGAQVIQNIAINAAACPAGSGVIGIQLHGAVGGGFIKDTVVFRPDGPCLLAENDGVTGFFPVQWDISNCTFAASRSSHGVQLSHLTDSNFVACYSHDNKLDGWNVFLCSNTVWTGCRGETNTQNGWRFTGMAATGTEAVLSGCVAELNQQSGFLFDASGSSIFGTYQLTGCMSNFDGQAAAGILAGFYDNGSKSRIMLTGCATMTNGIGPAYGAYEGSIAFGMAMSGCLTQGITAATHDDGTNTHALSNLVPVPF